jgi:hypothetical protein
MTGSYNYSGQNFIETLQIIDHQNVPLLIETLNEMKTVLLESDEKPDPHFSYTYYNKTIFICSMMNHEVLD